jgi:hypothetical protein
LRVYFEMKIEHREDLGIDTPGRLVVHLKCEGEGAVALLPPALLPGLKVRFSRFSDRLICSGTEVSEQILLYKTRGRL